MIPISADRKAQIEAYAQRHGQDPAEALDGLLAESLAWEDEDFEDTLASLREGFEHIKAGRTRPVEEVLEELRVKYGFPQDTPAPTSSCSR
jgi:predicted transcriptional regulator